MPPIRSSLARSSPRGDTAQAMSQENIERLRRGFEHFAATGEFLAENVHADFVWDMSTFRGWPEQQTYLGHRGREAVQRRMGRSMG